MSVPEIILRGGVLDGRGVGEPVQTFVAGRPLPRARAHTLIVRGLDISDLTCHSGARLDEVTRALEFTDWGHTMRGAWSAGVRSLELEHLATNASILEDAASPAEVWLHADGTVHGAVHAGRYADVRDVADEWARIAHAYPELDAVSWHFTEGDPGDPTFLTVIRAGRVWITPWDAELAELYVARSGYRPSRGPDFAAMDPALVEDAVAAWHAEREARGAQDGEFRMTAGELRAAVDAAREGR